MFIRISDTLSKMFIRDYDVILFSCFVIPLYCVKCLPSEGFFLRDEKSQEILTNFPEEVLCLGKNLSIGFFLNKVIFAL